MIIIVFGLSYLFRFVWSEFLYAGWYVEDTSFAKWLLHDIVIYFDGISLLAMLLLHKRNFRDHTKLKRDLSIEDGEDEEDDPIGIIRVSEYIYCPDEELESRPGQYPPRRKTETGMSDEW